MLGVSKIKTLRESLMGWDPGVTEGERVLQGGSHAARAELGGGPHPSGDGDGVKWRKVSSAPSPSLPNARTPEHQGVAGQGSAAQGTDTCGEKWQNHFFS